MTALIGDRFGRHCNQERGGYERAAPQFSEFCLMRTRPNHPLSRVSKNQTQTVQYKTLKAMRTFKLLIALCLIVAAFAATATTTTARSIPRRPHVSGGVRQRHEFVKRGPFVTPRLHRPHQGAAPLSDASTLGIDLARALDMLKKSTASTLQFSLSGFRQYSDYGGSTKGHETVDIGPLKGLRLNEVNSVRQLLAAAGYTEIVAPSIAGCFAKASGFMPLCMASPGLYVK